MTRDKTDQNMRSIRPATHHESGQKVTPLPRLLGRPTLFADGAVDAFAKEIGMPVVAGIFVDELEYPESHCLAARADGVEGVGFDQLVGVAARRWMRRRGRRAASRSVRAASCAVANPGEKSRKAAPPVGAARRR
jgi:hypothetical protein